MATIKYRSGRFDATTWNSTPTAHGAVKKVKIDIPEPLTQSQVSSFVNRPAKVTKTNAGANKKSFHGTKRKR